MGQSITVTQKQGLRHDVVRFELNRSLTGMGHERYTSRDQAVTVRPPDELARRLFDRGGVEGVHVYSNVVTIDLAPGARADGIADIIRDLFLFYRVPEGASGATLAPAAPAPSAVAAADPSEEGVTPPPA